MRLKIRSTWHELDSDHEAALRALFVGYQRIHRVDALRLMALGLVRHLGNARFMLTDAGRKVMEEER